MLGEPPSCHRYFVPFLHRAHCAYRLMRPFQLVVAHSILVLVPHIRRSRLCVSSLSLISSFGSFELGVRAAPSGASRGVLPFLLLSTENLKSPKDLRLSSLT